MVNNLNEVMGNSKFKPPVTRLNVALCHILHVTGILVNECKAKISHCYFPHGWNWYSIILLLLFCLESDFTRLCKCLKDSVYNWSILLINQYERHVNQSRVILSLDFRKSLTLYINIYIFCVDVSLDLFIYLPIYFYCIRSHRIQIIL